MPLMQRNSRLLKLASTDCSFKSLNLARPNYGGSQKAIGGAPENDRGLTISFRGGVHRDLRYRRYGDTPGGYLFYVLQDRAGARFRSIIAWHLYNPNEKLNQCKWAKQR